MKKEIYYQDYKEKEFFSLHLIEDIILNGIIIHKSINAFWFDVFKN